MDTNHQNFFSPKSNTSSSDVVVVKSSGSQDQDSFAKVDVIADKPNSSPSDDVVKVTNLFARQNLHDVPADKLNQLSAEERVEALYDLHGVSENLDDKPEDIAEKLMEMDMILDLVPPTDKEALLEAFRQNTRYVESLRISFLWAESLRPQQAVTRMIRHFEAKRQLFGSDKLGKDLSIHDLSAEEREYFRHGYVQFLPQRDRGGRALMMMHGKSQLDYPIITTMKICFLLFLIATQDEQIRKKGVVFIYYGVGQDTLNDTTPLIQSLTCLTGRIVAIHKCYDSESCESGATIASHAMMLKYLCRFQTHFGTHRECQHNLRTFGIPMDVLPIDSNGQLDCTQHWQWVDQLERHGSSSPSVSEADSLTLGPLDIIMGRGQRGVKSAGNQKLKRLLLKHQEAYETAPRFEKLIVAQMVVKEMMDSGSKFLFPTKDNKWVLADEDTVRSKIAQDFRNLRLSKKKP